MFDQVQVGEKEKESHCGVCITGLLGDLANLRNTEHSHRHCEYEVQRMMETKLALVFAWVPGFENLFQRNISGLCGDCAIFKVMQREGI